MADDVAVSAGKRRQAAQLRDRHGRYAQLALDRPDTLYDPTERQLYRLLRPGESCAPHTRLRRDRGLLYVCDVQSHLALGPDPVTNRAFGLGLAALVDAALSYAIAAWLDAHGIRAWDVRSTAVLLYVCCVGWVGTARFVSWVWQPPKPRPTFETIEEIAERNSWKPPEYGPSGRQRKAKGDDDADPGD